NALAPRYLDVGANREGQVARNEHDDVADGSFQTRVDKRSVPPRQSGEDWAASRLGAEAAADGAYLDAAAAGFDLGRHQDFIQLDVAASGLGLDPAQALAHGDPASSGFEGHQLPAADTQVAAAGLGDDLPGRGVDANVAAAGFGSHVGAGLADIDVAAA